MSRYHLETYLNDHLSGSVTALELLEYLERVQSGGPLEHSLVALRIDITEDRKCLEALMKQLEIETSFVRKVVAWLAEKAAEIKLRADDPDRKSLLMLEALEALSIGIEGKRLLWKSLAAAGLPNPPASDFLVLQRSAEEQRERVENLRLQCARCAIGIG